VPGVITTVAGNGVAGFSDGGPATSMLLNQPNWLAVDARGDVFISDLLNFRIRRVSRTTGVITTVAGNGVAAFSGDGGAATSASVNPTGVAVGPAALDSDLLIIDGYHRIRRVSSATGVITTVAGNDSYSGFSDGIAATSTSVCANGVAADADGDVIFSDCSNRIRRVSSATGVITTVAGNGVAGFSGDGGDATSASLSSPYGVAVSSNGDVLFSDAGNNRIRRVSRTAGTITTVAGNGYSGFGGDGGDATSASLSSPSGVAVGADGDLFFSDGFGIASPRVRRVSHVTGTITTVAGNGNDGFSGDGGAATSARLSGPYGVAVDFEGSLFVTEYSHSRVRRVAPPAPATRSPSPSASATPYCEPGAFRLLPRTDLVGALVGTALAPGGAVLLPAEGACRQACCDASACDGYTYDAAAARQLGSGACYLLVNVTQLVPANGMASGLVLAAL
jgi:trimeric autotransporter adhesin